MKALKPMLGIVILFASAIASADAVDDYVARQMERMRVPGVALAVMRSGEPVKQRGYGSANLELRAPVTADSVFMIGSISKQFIASGIMLLVHGGKVSLDDKINKYLESPPAAWEPITIRHLLTHTSGLVRESPGFDMLKIQSEAEIIKKAYDVPLQFTPGEKMVYCNLGYFILAEIIAKASGMAWPEFIDKRIFAPAGMTATRITAVKPVVPHRAEGYVLNQQREHENDPVLIANRPSGAFLSSLADLMKWERALVAATALPKATLEQMWQPTKLNDGSLSHYGFGWEVGPANGHAQIKHGGALAGFRSYYLRLPQDDLTVIVLTNLQTAPVDTIALGVAQHYVPGLFPARTSIQLKRAELERYVGRYQLGPAGIVTVSIVGDQLQLSAAVLGELLLSPEASNLFFVTDDSRVQAQFTPKDDGTLELAYMMNGTTAVKGPKLP
jgi:D-alanyl-D-alanine carboxypeptidase